MNSGGGGTEVCSNQRENPPMNDEESGSKATERKAHKTNCADEADGRGVVARARRLVTTDYGTVAFVQDVAWSLVIVAVIGLVLFSVGGLWPPLVAVESSSMAPNLQTGDLVFIMEEHRFAGAAAYDGTGVVTYQTGLAVEYTKFNKYGDVIVYQPNGNNHTTPVIHRARFWVRDGQNWYGEAKRVYLGGADNCAELSNCPSKHAGFVTKGDNNELYDQVSNAPISSPISEPVKPSWVTGTAEFRIPWLGRIRLVFDRTSTDAVSMAAPSSAASWSRNDFFAGLSFDF